MNGVETGALPTGKRMDRFVQYAMGAANEGIQPAGPGGDGINRARGGGSVGLGVGGGGGRQAQPPRPPRQRARRTRRATSRPFDQDRDGFVIGEGAAILVLETEDHARRRGARPICELAGYGASADAYHMTAPCEDGEGAARAMARALQDARMRPEDVTYVNAHGTSTPAGDPAEVAAVKRVFKDHSSRLMMSSTKSMTGHLLGAAGGIEAVATSLTLARGCVPPTINLDTPDPQCDLDFVPRQARAQRVTAAISNSFGNRALLKLALTHRSYLHVTGAGPRDSNERLEFLGDSVLGLVTSEHLYRKNPNEHEGQLTKTKSLLVSKAILSRRALAMGLGRYVLMSHSEVESGGRQRLSILADAFEAVIGSIYLDQGFGAARSFIERWLLREARVIAADKRHTNYKSHLQEYVQSTFRTHPVYRIRSAMGPDHSKQFMVEVMVGRKVLGEGRGRNKKEAEQAAARDALEQVGATPEPERAPASTGERAERTDRTERTAESRPSRRSEPDRDDDDKDDDSQHRRARRGGRGDGERGESGDRGERRAPAAPPPPPPPRPARPAPPPPPPNASRSGVVRAGREGAEPHTVARCTRRLRPRQFPARQALSR